MSIHDQLAVISVVLGFLIAADTARDLIQTKYRGWLRRRYEAERRERDDHFRWVSTFRAASVTPLMVPAAAAAVRNAAKFEEGMRQLQAAMKTSTSELQRVILGMNEFSRAVRPKPGPGRPRPKPGPGHQEIKT